MVKQVNGTNGQTKMLHKPIIAFIHRKVLCTVTLTCSRSPSFLHSRHLTRFLAPLVLCTFFFCSSLFQFSFSASQQPAVSSQHHILHNTQYRELVWTSKSNFVTREQAENCAERVMRVIVCVCCVWRWMGKMLHRRKSFNWFLLNILVLVDFIQQNVYGILRTEFSSTQQILHMLSTAPTIFLWKNFWLFSVGHEWWWWCSSNIQQWRKHDDKPWWQQLRPSRCQINKCPKINVNPRRGREVIEWRRMRFLVDSWCWNFSPRATWK